MLRSTPHPQRSISRVAVLILVVGLTACSSDGSVVYVDDEVRPTTSPPVIVPATTAPPTTIEP
jgi:hypothetical protein